MDLMSGAKRVIVAMQHAAKGHSTIVLALTEALPVSQGVNLSCPAAFGKPRYSNGTSHRATDF